ncbi:frizzled-3-like [Garra rufa]|uniref:frizzled-3-like n=1 Tax=Garra rufa TaxID=137080 RepID=UPI003CCE5BCC
MGVADFCVENKPLSSRSASQSCPAVFRHSSMGHIVDLPLWLFRALVLLSLFTSSLGIHMDSVGSHSMFTCESIGLRMCQDLPYNTTFMPNLLNHYDQQTAALAMESSRCQPPAVGLGGHVTQTALRLMVVHLSGVYSIPCGYRSSQVALEALKARSLTLKAQGFQSTCVVMETYERLLEEESSQRVRSAGSTPSGRETDRWRESYPDALPAGKFAAIDFKCTCVKTHAIVSLQTGISRSDREEIHGVLVASLSPPQIQRLCCVVFRDRDGLSCYFEWMRSGEQWRGEIRVMQEFELKDRPPPAVIKGAQVEQTSRPDLVLFLMKYLMVLVVGIPSVFWVGSKKTCFEWASFFHGRRRKDSGVVNESRQVLQEPDFAQSLLRDPNTPIIRKSRGTSTQGTSTHASSTHLAMLDDVRSKASSVHSKMSSYHGSLHRSRDGRFTPSSHRGMEERPAYGSMPRLNEQLSHHGSLHRLDSQSRHGSARDLSNAPAASITHGSSMNCVAEDDGTSA